ncbi:unnamed protein product [Kuraishia capsulata CBS 1993]|uniref:Zinc/iron permease n=1 Tax=Kuraishia capsulata CBS 1993 TaxID=1382522 RepID=W6MTT7_9ASCO|nr:uncharacterized protein KUCA_T00005902001 [Kuraishia capsulata CBS 1993]CDK29908.1 unnamed protein product [Kuraishia capsulata CBS 1993]
MSGFGTVLVLSLLMGISSFLSGLIPIVVRLSSSKLKLISVFGAGVLLSAALVLIIPEGLEKVEEKGSNLTGIMLLLGYFTLHMVQNVPQILSPRNKDYYKTSAVEDLNLEDTELPVLESPPISKPKTILIEAQTQFKNACKSPFTLGLMIHSFCDGIALASTVYAADIRLQLTILFAIFIHKLPAAFGLTSILRSHNLAKSGIMWHLFFFAVSAPIAAVLAFGVFSIVSASDENGSYVSGLLLLFSGGSFLYVAFHALSDTMENHGGEILNGGDMSSIEEPSDERPLELGASALGMLLPVLVSLAKE